MILSNENMSVDICWNFRDNFYQKINIFFITARRYQSPHPPGEDEMRLLVLTHKIASQEIPSYFLGNPPSFIRSMPSQPVITVFDINNNFSEDLIPEWAIIQPSEWDVQNDTTQIHLDLFQRALNLQLFYKFIDKEPAYFPTFIIIPLAQPYEQPQAIKVFPLIKDNGIIIRSCVENFSSLSLGPRKPANDSFILIPPYEIPYKVINALVTKITATSPNGQKKVIDSLTNTYFIISEPSKMLQSLFTSRPSGHSISSFRMKSSFSSRPLDKDIIRIKPINLQTTTTDMSLSFFAEKFSKKSAIPESKNETDECEKDVLVDPPLNFEDKINEVIFDNDKLKKIIAWSIGAYTMTAETISSFGNIEDSPVVSPQLMETFCDDFNSFSYTETPILAGYFSSDTSAYIIQNPSIEVNVEGKNQEQSISTLVDWEKFKFMPLYLPKDGEYIVFFEKGVKKDAVIDYFQQLTHSYSQLGFGKMIKFNQSYPPFVETEVGQSRNRADNFYQEHQAEFNRVNHLIIYIITNNVTQHNVYQNRLKYGLRVLSPGKINYSTDEDFKEEAFKLYSMIRCQQNGPQNQFSSKSNPPLILNNFFFGHRYQHPFIIFRKEDIVNIHIFLNPENDHIVICDQVGTALQKLKVPDPIQTLKKIMQELSRLCGYTIQINFMLTYFAEFVDEYLFNKALELQTDFKQNFYLFNLYPSPYVQCNITDEYQNDFYIESSPEYSHLPKSVSNPAERGIKAGVKPSLGNLKIVHPVRNGFVLTHEHQHYQIGLLSCPAISDPASAMESYRNQMVGLSWLTARPNYPKRAYSLPPPIAMLISECDHQSCLYSRFVFSEEYKNRDI